MIQELTGGGGGAPGFGGGGGGGGAGPSVGFFFGPSPSFLVFTLNLLSSFSSGISGIGFGFILAYSGFH